MKNSISRRLFFQLVSSCRFILYGFKHKESFKFRNYFSPLLGRFWSYKYYDVCGIQSDMYLSEPFFYNKLEASVNDFSLAKYFEHKGYLNNTLGDHDVENIINCISGAIYLTNGTTISICEVDDFFSQYQPQDEFVLKISVGTGGGKGVMIGEYSKIRVTLKSYYEQGLDFLVQLKITQHGELKKFNPKSLNTIRLMTFCYKGNPELVSTVFRMGNGGTVDNSAAGGIAIGVYDDGFLRDFAIDHDFNRYLVHPYSKVSFQEKHKIPFFDNIKKLVLNKHLNLRSHGLVSWDVSVDDEGRISIIEFNVVWSELNFHQATNGPIFKKFLPHLKEIVNES